MLNRRKEGDREGSFTCVADGGRNTVDYVLVNTGIYDRINKWINGKAHGVDGILNEAIKASKNLILPLLIKALQHDFNEGLFPTSWGIGIIVSIFKSGIKTNPGNYRGISLLSNLSKIFTSIINQRIMLWSEQEKINGQC